MARCEYCGCAITPDMKVCESCGAPIPEDAFAEESSARDDRYSDGADYRLIVISRGSCSRSQAEDLLEDLLQYDTQESREIMDSLPAEAARNLTEEQASYLAQALTEYGMEVSVCNQYGYVDLGSAEKGSLFDSDGNYIRRFAEILAMLTAANRVLRPMRWGQPIDRGHIFMRDYRPPHPPVHRRRSRSLLERLFGAPEPPRRRPEPVPPMAGRPKPAPRRESMMRPEQERGGRTPMGGAGSMRGGTPSMGRSGGPGGSSMGGRSRSGGSASMGRSGGPGGSSMGGRSRGGSSPMGRSGGSGGGRPGGSRGPSRGHGAR